MTNFSAFEEALENAMEAITELRKEAEEIRDKMDDIITACETIEDEI